MLEPEAKIVLTLAHTFNLPANLGKPQAGRTSEAMNNALKVSNVCA